MLTVLKNNIKDYLVNEENNKFRLTPSSKLVLGDETHEIFSSTREIRFARETLETALSLQPSHHVSTDIVELADDERDVFICSSEHAMDLFASFIILNIIFFVETSNDEDKNIEFIVNTGENSYYLYVLIEGDIQVLALGFTKKEEVK